MTTRTQDLLLLLLAVATAAAVFFAVTRVHPSGAEDDSPTDPMSSATRGDPSSTPGPTGDDPSPSPGDDEAAASASAEETTTSPSADDPASSLEEFAAAVAGDGETPISVLVLGDDTSNNRSEWVHLWGELASADRPVEVVHWAEASDVTYNEPDLFSEDGDGSPLTIWNASRAGANVAVTTERIDDYIPPDTELEAVIINLGANDDASSIPADLDDLRAAIQERLGDIPTAVVAQGQAGVDSEVLDATFDWADAAALPVLVASGASSAQEWASLVSDSLNN